jgi:hypothetical protein
MWDTDLIEGGPSDLNSNAELYQLWLNLPPRSKLVAPSVQLLSPTQEDRRGGGFAPKAFEAAASAVPLSVVPLLSAAPRGPGNLGVAVKVLAGAAHGVQSATRTHSPVTVCHATLEPGGAWSLPLPPHYTALVYVRKVGETAEAKLMFALAFALSLCAACVRVDDFCPPPPRGASRCQGRGGVRAARWRRTNSLTWPKAPPKAAWRRHSTVCR